MPMSSGGHVASSSGCATRPKVREIGLTGCAVPTQRSLLIGSYVMATAEHREPCDSRGSCTVLGAPSGEIPPGDSTVRFTPQSGHAIHYPRRELLANAGGPRRILDVEASHLALSKTEDVSDRLVLQPVRLSLKRFAFEIAD